MVHRNNIPSVLSLLNRCVAGQCQLQECSLLSGEAPNVLVMGLYDIVIKHLNFIYGVIKKERLR